MRAVILTGVAMLALAGPATAQRWTPPRPGPNGVDTCSGWDTPEAQAACRAKEAAAQAEHDKSMNDRAARVLADAAAEAQRIAAMRADQAAEAAQAAAQRQIDEKARAEQVERERLAAAAAAQAEADDAEAQAKADAADEYKRADILDAFVAPEKFLYKKVKFAPMQCYAVAASDFRCFVAGDAPVIITAPTVGPEVEKDRLENECSTIRQAASPTCLRTVRLAVLGFEADHTPDGLPRQRLNTLALQLSDPPRH